MRPGTDFDHRVLLASLAPERRRALCARADGPAPARLAWNMPFHAEQHACPAVPFHKLPLLHEEVRRHLRAERGYARFNRGYAVAAAAGALPDTPGRG